MGGKGGLLNSPGGVQHRRLLLQLRRLQLCHHELHLCDCCPLHHGSWLPDTLDPVPQLSKRRAVNIPVGRTKTEFKNFFSRSVTQICSTITDAAFKKLRLSNCPLQSPAFSPSNCYRPTGRFCSA